MSEPAKCTLQWRRRRLVWLGVAVLASPLVWETYRVFLGDNLHTLIAGKVYRSAQLSNRDLQRFIRSHGIRTVVNLRGCSDPCPWYLDECRATHDCNVSQEDVGFSAGRYPSAHELRRLVDILDRSEYPILLHCRQGADRTGLAAVLVALLQTDASLEEARRQMSLRYGHVALGRPANLDRFLDLYCFWLHQQGREHSRDTVREWIRDARFPGDLVCRLEAVDLPASLPSGQPRAVTVRAHNLGSKPWHFRTGTNVGIHICLWLYDAEDRCVKSEHSGLFEAIVPPNESIDLPLAIPSLPPGKYRLVVDMIDEQHCFFFQVGSEPLERELVVQ